MEDDDACWCVSDAPRSILGSDTNDDEDECGGIVGGGGSRLPPMGALVGLVCLVGYVGLLMGLTSTAEEGW